ncbi:MULTISPECIES: VanZ family protein [unclassified Streptomyces]|uniref:VanZ family protein n=1 Tax=unclassified Streptomyces TaxID=2593676 RepID=UPI001F2921F2|nr:MULTISPECIES: VanZ family protein [unclassified Streptomyces]
MDGTVGTKAGDPVPAAPAPPPEPPREAAEPRREAAEPRREAAEPRRPGRVVRVLVALVALVGMVAFAIVLAKLTLNASPASVPLTHSNLKPGSSIRAYLEQPAFLETVKQLGGNILLGVPFGVLLPLFSRKTRGVVRVALLTIVTMLLVELVQGALITGRAFDIDDVMLNTTGALLGYLLVGRRLGRAVHPRVGRRWWQRRPVRQKGSERALAAER